MLLPPGHFHDVWSIGLILDGACRFTSGGVEHVAPTGSVFILPPYELHVCGAADADVRYAVLYVEAAVMHQQAPRLAAGVGHMSAACDWLAALDRALNATLAPRSTAPATHEALHPLQRYFHAIGLHRWIWLADKTWSLADIALQLGFADQAHFTRVFKQVYGVPPGHLRKLLMRLTLDS